MLRRMLVAVALFAAMLGAAGTASADGGREVKLGTLAPKDSAWWEPAPETRPRP